jgi:hypothetical protein
MIMAMVVDPYPIGVLLFYIRKMDKNGKKIEH